MRFRNPFKVDSWWGGFALVALALALLPMVASTYNMTLLIVYSVLGLSLGLTWGIGGVLCFGQGAFFGAGAYVYAIAAINLQAAGLGTAAAFALAIALPGIFALLLGAMMFYGRISDVYLGVITLVVTLILYKYLNAASGPSDAIGQAPLGGFNGIPGFPPLSLGSVDAPWIEFSGDSLYWLSAGCLLAVWLLGRFLVRSSAGRILIGVRENELRAQLLGYDTRVLKTLVFGLGGAIAGLAGALYACWAEIVTPGLFSLSQSAEVIVWVIVGGLGTLGGPMLGAVLLGLIKTQLASQTLINNQLVIGAILLLTVLALPRGLLPALAGWSIRWRARAQGRAGRQAMPAADVEVKGLRDA